MTESLCCRKFPSHPKKCSSLGASARRGSARGTASMLEPVISGLAKSILRNFLRVLARRRMGSMGCLRPLIWQRSVAQERVEFAENFYQIAGKSRSRRGGGSPFAPYNPRQNLVPVLGSDRPAGMLRPFSFLRSVPVAYVAPAQTLFLFGDRKSTRLNSSHPSISYAVFCLKKKSIDL